ncbi:MAG: beta-ketoacyl synthase N-terminal-like domain-containing protein [Planctomycetota bacterium]|nr:beta-ketoacyl synthase N-terminal-like domain-containing protein [Planctomycetota bacterium]
MRAPRDHDAVITGAGCVSALGYGLPEVFAGLDAGRTAIRRSDEAARDERFGSLARMEPPYLRREVPRELEPQIKFLNGAGELAVEAASEAADASGLSDAGLPPDRRGLYLSQVDSDDWLCSDFAPGIRAAAADPEDPLDREALNRASARRVMPFFMLTSLKNNAFSFLATMLELRGANTSLAGFAGPTQLGLDMAVRSLEHHRLDAALVVGAARPTSSVALAEMSAYGVPQPPGDGAGALALRRHADVAPDARLAHVLGLGTATYAVEPDTRQLSSDALQAAAAEALEQAETRPEELAAIVAPGLGEDADALRAVADVPTIAWTAALGHCALAWETMQVALAVQCLREGRLPGGEPWDGRRPLLVLGAGLLGQASAVVLA